jgi:hypothetical protein
MTPVLLMGPNNNTDGYSGPIIPTVGQLGLIISVTSNRSLVGLKASQVLLSGRTNKS